MPDQTARCQAYEIGFRPARTVRCDRPATAVVRKPGNAPRIVCPAHAATEVNPDLDQSLPIPLRACSPEMLLAIARGESDYVEEIERDIAHYCRVSATASERATAAWREHARRTAPRATQGVLLG